MAGTLLEKKRVVQITSLLVTVILSIQLVAILAMSLLFCIPSLLALFLIGDTKRDAIIT